MEDAEIEDETIKPNYGFDYEFITPHSDEKETNKKVDDHRQPQDEAEDDQEEPEYHFRLFTSTNTTSTSKQPAQPPSQAQPKATIRLSATPPPEDFIESTALSLERAGFIRPNRPDDYYFTSSLPADVTETLKSQYAQTALSNSDVLSRARFPKWPGTALPWRCIHVHLLSSGNPKETSKSIDSHGSPNKPSTAPRPRPSKKRRILHRRRLALRADLALQAEKADELDRQKRTQRNREKKVKRKEREKLKKQQQQQQAQALDEKKTGLAEPLSPSTATTPANIVSSK